MENEEPKVGVKLGNACPVTDGTCPRDCGFPVHFTVTRAKQEPIVDEFQLGSQQSQDTEECESCSA